MLSEKCRLAIGYQLTGIHHCLRFPWSAKFSPQVSLARPPQAGKQTSQKLKKVKNNQRYSISKRQSRIAQALLGYTPIRNWLKSRILKQIKDHIWQVGGAKDFVSGAKQGRQNQETKWNFKHCDPWWRVLREHLGKYHVKSSAEVEMSRLARRSFPSHRWHFPPPTAVKGTETEPSCGGLRPNNQKVLWRTSLGLSEGRGQRDLRHPHRCDSRRGIRSESDVAQPACTVLGSRDYHGVSNPDRIAGGRLVPWTSWSMADTVFSDPCCRWSWGLQERICSDSNNTKKIFSFVQHWLPNGLKWAFCVAVAAAKKEKKKLSNTAWEVVAILPLASTSNGRLAFCRHVPRCQ